LDGLADFLLMTDLNSSSQAPAALPRRSFLRVAGASAAAAGLVLAGCSDDPDPVAVDPNRLALSTSPNTGQLDDSGLLNYILLLEQLEAAFYQKVIGAPPTDLRPGELAIFTDLRDHEVVHRESLRFALGANAYDRALTTPLPLDFSGFTLTTRAGVLAAAQQLEDLGVAAYAGALPLVASTATVALLAKMSSVEARHAALVRDLVAPGTFAGDEVVVSTGGLQSVSLAKTPAQVVAETKAFFAPIVVVVPTV
jgi:hypothetical protein